MTAKTPNQRKADERARYRAQGLVKREYWLKPAHIPKVKAFISGLK